MTTIIDSLNKVEKVLPYITDDGYIEILQKTNQQLSLWYNPYGLFIAALGILFTLMTIVSAVIIYWQNKGHTERINEIEMNYKNKLDEFNKNIEENQDLAQNTKKVLEKLISEYKEKLGKNIAIDDGLNNKITNLEEQNKSIKLRSQYDVVMPEFDSYIGPQEKQFHKCSHCGYGFYVEKKGLLRLGNSIVKCPKCSNLDNFW